MRLLLKCQRPFVKLEPVPCLPAASALDTEPLASRTDWLCQVALLTSAFYSNNKAELDIAFLRCRRQASQPRLEGPRGMLEIEFGFKK